MTRRYPLAHRISIPQPYVPAVATDIRKTIKAERVKLAAAEAAKTAPKVATLRRRAAGGTS
jgi:hypothetical protein